MMIKVKFLSPVRELLKREEEEIEIDRDFTVMDLLERLAVKYGESFRQVPCIILVNDKGINQLEGESTKLKEGDRVPFLPKLSGG